MSDLFKEMFALSGKLNALINETKDEETKNELLAKYFKINQQCEEIANEKFDEHDEFYNKTIKKINNTEKLIKEFKANQIKLVNVFVHLIDIIANVEKILLGWKVNNGK